MALATPGIGGKAMTHEWRIYVTGNEGDHKFQQFVEKVVFSLDRTYKDWRKSCRVRQRRWERGEER